MLKPRAFALLIFLSFFSGSALAVNCLRASTPLENTVCNNDNLRWLDSTMTVIYRTMLVNNDSRKVRKDYTQWESSLESCTTDSCIERAYYEGIGKISDVDNQFDWQGQWWNMRAPNMSGGTIQFSRSAEWSITIDMHAWAGLNKDDFTAEARKIYGMAVVEKMIDTSNCRLLIIPKKDGFLQVHSNADLGCRLLMPSGVFFDGRYEKSNSDPRPKPTLFTLGIFDNKARDKRFHALTGEDYQKFVETANMFIYQDDIDNIGARVLSMWVRGAANRQTAIIMYTPEGKIWAGRISPSAQGELQLHYYTSENKDVKYMPRTLVRWKMRFLNN
ncbi:lysozyme inhibitor LprI family protein [Cedecea colo]|uniref:Uncharacterized protein n=1 Tax=Cedecea colo TaxID=2552946 RepID=A0ABX0VLH7_9ENTR|nr:hypothetical protein [Cedecea colo]NIY47445.1 hypothetical protein [Cedecea colo]